MHYKLFGTGTAKNGWAVILAGGDGLRLRSFVEKLRGDYLPKQYVRFLGAHSLLEGTLQRTRTLIPSNRQYVVVTESHFGYAEVPQPLSNYPEVHVTAQPINRDTGMGLLVLLAQIYKICPDWTVVLFPSDHLIKEEGLWSDWGSEKRIMSTARHALDCRFAFESSSNPFNIVLERRVAGTT